MKTQLLKALAVALLFLGASTYQVLHGQTRTITGVLVSEATGDLLQGVSVQVTSSDLSTTTDENGAFTLSGRISSPVTLVFTEDAVALERTFDLVNGDNDLGRISVVFNSGTELRDQVFTIQISDDESDQDGADNISGLLTASSDVFQTSAAYVFGPMRFRLRGYDSENNRMTLNGAPFNDLEVGSVFWSNWGGLNDVTRDQETHLGLENAPFGFGGVGGAVALDLRASEQRSGTRLAYSLTNRAYRNRIIGSWSTGLTPSGWALTLGGSRRWSQEGYVDGTFYDAYSYFVSVDKKLSEKHMLNFVFFGAPAKRGKDGAATEEMFDLAGTNYYNPYWGYQGGEKRNSRVSDIHQPVAMLRHDWKFAPNSVWTTSAAFQTGKNASSALDWFNANDPRPDYYRRLPSYIDDPVLSAKVEAALRGDETLRQIRWDDLYRVNYESNVTINNVDGIAGNTVTGRQSQYIVEDRRYDNTRFILATSVQHTLNDRVKVDGGLHYSMQLNENYKVVKDLLGGEFYVNFDKFALQDFPGNTDAQQNDLNHPNQLVYEGDVFGYDYDANIRNGEIWGQIGVSSPHFDYHFGATGGSTSFWRTGNMRNGKFPEDSFGDSEKKQFYHGGVKAGVTWKINGRNYFVVNGMALSRAPYFRNAMVSPRIRNQFVDGLTTEKIFSGEASYIFRAPYFKARLTGYYTQFLDQALARSFYHDDERSFVNIAMTGIDQEHMGIEGFVEATVTTGIKVHGVAAVGQYLYTSRPEAVITQDNSALVLNKTTVYAKNFYVSGTPQSAYTVGASFQTKHYLSFYLNFNYFDDLWIDYNPIRRTAEAVDLVEEGSAQWDAIIEQEKAEGGFTMDASVYKSFRLNWFKKPVYFAISFNVTNVLDKQDLLSGGYEQLRFDFAEKDVNTFPSKYYYFSGFNYFLNASIRF